MILVNFSPKNCQKTKVTAIKETSNWLLQSLSKWERFLRFHISRYSFCPSMSKTESIFSMSAFIYLYRDPKLNSSFFSIPMIDKLSRIFKNETALFWSEEMNNQHNDQGLFEKPSFDQWKKQGWTLTIWMYVWNV